MTKYSCGECVFYAKTEEALAKHKQVHVIQNTFGQITGLDLGEG